MPLQDDPRRSHSRVAARLRLALLPLFVCVVVAPPFQLRLFAHMGPDTYCDLYSPWTGARFALHRVDPYSPAVTAQIQTDLYGHAFTPSDTRDPEAFVYPLYAVFPLAPLAPLSWQAAQSLVSAIVPFFVLAATLAWMRIYAREVDRGTSIAAVILIIASWPSIWGCFERQPSVFVATALAFSVLLYIRGSDTLAGVLLACATIKPQLVVLLATWLLLQAIRFRRWRFLTGFTVTFAFLVGGSLALIPDWIPHWIGAIVAYTHAAGKVPLLSFIFGRKLGPLFSGALFIALCVRLRQLWHSSANPAEFRQCVAVLLAATVCLMPANPWLIFNDLLLIPAVLLLASTRPVNSFVALLHSIAWLAIVLALLITPLCAALSAHLGFSINLVMPPFVINYLLPLPITIALLCSRIESAKPERSSPLSEPREGTHRAPEPLAVSG
jgi:hypothetical protein